MFNRSNSVDGIMSSFTKTIAKLNKLADDKLVESAIQTDQGKNLLAQADAMFEKAKDTRRERDRAEAMAAKLQDFMNG